MDYKKLGKRIKEERLKKSLTQEKLAELIGVTGVYISHIECASAKPSLDTLINICNALGTTPDYFLFDSIHTSREYIKDEIAVLLKPCSTEDLDLITKLIKAVLTK